MTASRESKKFSRLLLTGDIGDAIAALPILRALGGGTIVFTEAHGKGRQPRETMRGPRFDALRPLLLAQPYVTDVEWQDHPTDITHDLSGFRQVREGTTESLADWQARYLGVKIRLEPWLIVTQPFEQHGKVVMARTTRYHNYFFPWQDLIRQHIGNTIFVGLESERDELTRDTGYPLEYRHTADLLELARVIAGACLTISNQSCPFWIAAGLGVPLIQESWQGSLNSIVPRSNAVYTTTDLDTRTLMLRLYPRKKAVAV